MPAKKTPAKKASAKKSAPKKAAVDKTVPAKKAPAKTSPAKKAAAAKGHAPLTTITAKIDIGFGNELYLRGEGGGLNWDRGLLMDCVDSGEWSWSGPSSSGIDFKFLINDELWSLGEDLTVPAGGVAVTAPRF